MTGAHYIFNEARGDLPDLGGIERSLEKRSRHRRALLRLLFEAWNTQRLLICIDPANFDLIADLQADRAGGRLLEIECSFSDDYLRGHARRVGLASEQSVPEVLESLLPTLRCDLRFEADRLADAGFEGVERISEAQGAEQNALPLSRFLGIPVQQAHEILSADYLFVD